MFKEFLDTIFKLPPIEKRRRVNIPKTKFLAILAILSFLSCCGLLLESKEAVLVRDNLDSFIESGEQSRKAEKIFQGISFPEIETICLFVDRDSEPQSAEKYARLHFENRILELEDVDYGAIIILASKEDHKIIQLRDQSVYNNNTTYFLYVDVKEQLSRYEGCAPFSTAVFEVRNGQFHRNIVLSSQQIGENR